MVPLFLFLLIPLASLSLSLSMPKGLTIGSLSLAKRGKRRKARRVTGRRRMGARRTVGLQIP